MNSLVSTPWLRVQVTHEEDSAVFILDGVLFDERDGSEIGLGGAQVRLGEVPFFLSGQGFQKTSELLFFLQHVQSLVTPVLERLALHVERPSFPVFVGVSGTKPAMELRQLLRAVMSEVKTVVPVEIIDAPEKWTASLDPVELPIRIVVAGDEHAEALVARIEADEWYLGRPNVRQFGMTLTHWPANELWGGKTAGHADILIMPLGAWLETRADYLSLGLARPRLIVILDGSDDNVRLSSAWPFTDTAVLRLPVQDRGHAGALLVFLLRHIVHDLPLHEVVRLMRGEFYRDSSDVPQLIADPCTDNGLRLSPVARLVEALLARHRDLEHRETADVAAFVAKLGQRLDAERVRAFASVLDASERTAESYRYVRQRGISFRGEGTGLVPLSESMAAAAELRTQEPAMERTLRELLQHPEAMEVVEQAQERKVDARLFAVYQDHKPVPVSSRERLPPGSLVQLTVHIGQRARDSLIVGDAPALDPLLPPMPGEQPHELKFVIFPKDFKLQPGYEAMQAVSLPRLGGSRAVSWVLRVPEINPHAATRKASVEVIDSGTGSVFGDMAELRFAVYFRNQMLQSFRLSARLGNVWPPEPEPCLRIECDFSQTRRFGELEAVGTRLLSAALNDDPGAGTHTLMLVKGDQHLALRWPETLMDRLAEPVRKRLWDALGMGQGAAQFPFDAQTLALQRPPSDVCDAVVRDLAHAGRELFTQLLMSHPNGADILKDVATTQDDTLQFFRLDPNLSFPWPLIYSHTVPRPGVDRGSVPVCYGHQDGAPCQCSGQTPGYCVRGFWGLRHVIEQRCPGQDTDSTAKGKIADSRPTPLTAAMPVVNNQWVTTMIERLRQNDASHASLPVQPVLDCLRVAEQRPALVVIVSHLKQAASSLGLPMPLLKPDDDSAPLLCVEDIGNEITNHQRWAMPRSLVLLLACGSGASRIDSGTSLGVALVGLGAVGVLGTECEVPTSIAARVGRDVIDHLFSGHRMGKAMQLTLTGLAAEGCLLGLAFTYLGSAEAYLPS